MQVLSAEKLCCPFLAGASCGAMQCHKFLLGDSQSFSQHYSPGLFREETLNGKGELDYPFCFAVICSPLALGKLPVVNVSFFLP